MTTRDRLLLFGLLLASAACANPRQTAPLPPASGEEISLVGVYQYETVLNRGAEPGGVGARLPEAVSGTLRLEEQEGRLTGEITASNRTAMPITSVIRNRNEATIQARGPDGSPITLRIAFYGDSFSGQWIESNGVAAPVRGARRR